MTRPIRVYKNILTFFTIEQRIDSDEKKINENEDIEALEPIREDYLGNKVNILI